MEKSRKIESVKITDISDNTLLCILDFLSFTDQFHLSLTCKRFNENIYKRKGIWKYVNIIDIFLMCDLNPGGLGNSKVTPERLNFGLSRIDCTEIRRVVFPFINSLDYLLPSPPMMPKVKSITFLIDSISDFEQITREMTKKVSVLPPNLQVVIFDIKPLVLDDEFKKKNAFSKSFGSELTNLRTMLTERRVQFNMSLCKECSTPIFLKNKCVECSKLICSKCARPRRCVLCVRVHCKDHIRTYCNDCGRNFFLCVNCKQDEYESCLECDRTFCKKHEEFMVECKICGEVFCDSKNCTYLCDGCDKVSCNDCEPKGCPNCGKKFCAMCVNDCNCFTECEVCSTKICEKCMQECAECLAQTCKWCAGRCCVSSGEEDNAIILPGIPGRKRGKK